MDDKQDFTQGSIFKKMIHFMFPILGALILQAPGFLAQFRKLIEKYVCNLCLILFHN